MKVIELGLMKVFTPDEAKRVLPYVRRIVADVVETHATWDEAFLTDEGDRADDRPFHLVAELRQAGVVLRDFQQGIVSIDVQDGTAETAMFWQPGMDEWVSCREAST